MSQEGFVQLQPDSTGKKVEMEVVVSAVDGSVLYRQRASITGDAADSLSQIPALLRQILAAQRAMLSILQQTSNLSVGEEDFPGD